MDESVSAINSLSPLKLRDFFLFFEGGGSLAMCSYY